MRSSGNGVVVGSSNDDPETERTINDFHSRLYSKYNSLRKEKDFIGFYSLFELTSQEDEIQIDVFKKALYNFYYSISEDEPKINRIISKYKKRYENVILLNKLKKDFDKYLTDNDINKRIEQEESKESKLNKIYFKIKQKQSPDDLYKKFQEKDTEGWEELDKLTFDNVLNSIIVLMPNEKELLYEDLKGGFGNKIQYKKLIEKIQSINKGIVLPSQGPIDQSHKYLIIQIREKATKANLNMNKIWETEFRGENSIGFNEFKTMIMKYNKVFQLNESQISEVFEIISNDGTFVNYNDYSNSMRIETNNGPNDSPLRRLENPFESINNNDPFNGSINDRPGDLKNTILVQSINQSVSPQFINQTTNSINQDNVYNSNISNHPYDSSQKEETYHSFIAIRSKERFEEIERTDDLNVQKKIIDVRVRKTFDKINKIKSLHERYVVLNYFDIFHKNLNLLRQKFSENSGNSEKVSLEIFSLVLQSLQINIDPKRLELILNSLTMKTLNLYSYEEFLNRAEHFDQSSKDYEELLAINRTCNLQFNDYIYDFKKFIIDRKLNVQSHFDNSSYMNIDQFKEFCNNIDYKLSHEIEYKLLFDNLKYPHDFLIRDELLSFIQSRFMSVEEFIKSGEIKGSKIQPDYKWKHKINKKEDVFGNDAEILKTKYKKFKTIFQTIRYQLKNGYNIDDITSIFDEVNEEINQDTAEIPEDVFIKQMKLKNIGQYQTLIHEFKSQSNNIFLAQFISVYLLFEKETNAFKNCFNDLGSCITEGWQKPIEEAIESLDTDKDGYFILNSLKDHLKNENYDEASLKIFEKLFSLIIDEKNKDDIDVIKCDYLIDLINFYPHHRENKLIRDYGLFLYKNKLPFNKIYPNVERNDTINSVEFSEGFRRANFFITDDEIDCLLTYLDPKNKENIEINKFKEEITKKSPLYQETPLDKLIQYLSENGNSTSIFFHQLYNQSKPNTPIYKHDFVNSLYNISFLTDDEKSDIFNQIDKNNKGFITYGELIEFFGTKNEKEKYRKDLKLHSQINKSFDELDTNYDQFITRDDLLKIIKYIEEQTSMHDLDNYLSKYNLNNYNNIDKKTYNEILFQLVNDLFQKTEKDKEYFISSLKQMDHEGLLTNEELQTAIKGISFCRISNDELNNAIKCSKNDNDDLINIYKFVEVLYEENIFGNNLQATILNLKKKLKILSPLPSPPNFKTSFIRDIQKNLKLLPCQMICPRRTPDQKSFIDVKPQESFISDDNKNNIQMKPLPTDVNTLIFFESATGIPNPDEFLLNQNNNQIALVSKQLKIALFDTNKRVFISNAFSIQVKTKQEQDKWNFESERTNFNNNILIRYQPDKFIPNSSTDIEIVFEFVLTIKQKQEITETSWGWCSCPIKDLYKSHDKKLEIKGGTPLYPETLNQTFTKTKPHELSQKPFENAISILLIKITHYNDLNNDYKKIIDYLPTSCIIPKASLHLIYIFRKIVGDCILNIKTYKQSVIRSINFLVKSFSKIVDSPDTFRNMTELWNEIIIEKANNSDGKNDDYFKINFVEFVNRIQALLYYEKYKYNIKDPTLEPKGNNELMERRKKLINKIIRSIDFYKNNKKNYIDEMTKLKPMNENTLDI